MPEIAPPSPTPLDLRGLHCPRLVLALAEALRNALPGQHFRVLTTDPLAAIDLPFYLSRHGHALLRRERLQGGDAFIIGIGMAAPEAA